MVLGRYRWTYVLDEPVSLPRSPDGKVISFTEHEQMSA